MSYQPKKFTTGTYIFKRPGGIDDRADLAVRVQLDKFVHDVPDVLVLALLMEKGSELESSDCLVLVIQLDWANLINLPPLQRQHRNSYCM
jgi:hypothetical protein